MQLTKKKINNKENTKPLLPKRIIHINPVHSSNLNTINYTEDLRLMTLPYQFTFNNQIKNLVKSIQIKKNSHNFMSSIAGSKKNVSRKSRSKSAKQALNIQPIRFKNIMKQFKELKLMHEIEKSKSKSPLSNKSRSTKKRSKKPSFATLRTNPHSQKNLTLKLQKTLKKLNDVDYFRDEQDSLIPIVSSSDMYNAQQQKALIQNHNNFLRKAQLLQNQEEDINLLELREFCSIRKTTNNFYSQPNVIKKPINTANKMNLSMFKDNLYEMMAIKIQKAWRRYQTKRLVNRYVNYFQNNQSKGDEGFENGSNSHDFSIEESISEERKNEKHNKHEQSFDNEKQKERDELKMLIKLKKQKDHVHTQRSDEIVMVIPRGEGEHFYNQEDNPGHKVTQISNLEEDAQVQLEEFLNLHEKTDKINQTNQRKHKKIDLLGSNHHQDKESMRKQKSSESFEEENSNGSESYEQAVKRIKLEQLQKWNKIITLISDNKSDNPLQREELLNKLAKQSENNKKDLENKANTILTYTSRKKEQNYRENQSQEQMRIQQSQRIQNKQVKNHNFIEANPKSVLNNQGKIKRQKEVVNSEDSEEEIAKIERQDAQENEGSESQSNLNKEEYDSKKYIEYLDGDMFPGQKNYSSSNSSLKIRDEEELVSQDEKVFQRKGQVISKKKQEILLNQMKYRSNLEIKLYYQNNIGRSQSLTNLQKKHKQYKNLLKKSTSEKNLKKALRSISPAILSSNEDQFNDDEINLQLLARQFLEASDPMQNLQIIHSEQKLKVKLSQLNKMKIIQEEEEAEELHHIKEKYRDDEQNRKNLTYFNILDEEDDQSEREKEIQRAQQLQRFREKYGQHGHTELPHQFGNQGQKLKNIMDQKLGSDQQQEQSRIGLRNHHEEDAELRRKGLERQSQQNQLHHQHKYQKQEPIAIKESHVKDKHHLFQEYLEDSIENNQIDSSDDEMLLKESQEKAEHIAILILDTLLFELFREIAQTSTKILNSFKSYMLSAKAKLKRAVEATQSKKKGFPTNQQQIKSVIQNLINYIEQSEGSIFRNLEIATGPSALEMLKYMHQGVDQESLNYEDEEEEDQSNVMVIPNRIFEKFWHIKERVILEAQKNTIIPNNFQIWKGFNKIFIRSLFDTFNQCLDYQRNYGQFGKPFPWKNNAIFYHAKTDGEIKERVLSAKKRILELSATYCGLIIEKEEILNLQGNEEYLQQVQEDRLSRMLASDLIEAEQRWVFYDDEETEILVEISNIVYLEVILECMQEIMTHPNLTFFSN